MSPRAKPTRGLLLAFSVLVVVPACEEATPEIEEVIREPLVTKEASRAISGDAPQLPSVYKGLRLGMTAEEAKAIFPDMPEEDAIRVPEHPDTTFFVDFGEDSSRVRRVFFAIRGDHVREKIEKTWGPAIETTEAGKPRLVWFNPAAGIRAALYQGFEAMDLEFTQYMPYETLLGAQGRELAFEAPRPLLGSTLEELKAAYGSALVEIAAPKPAAGEPTSATGGAPARPRTPNVYLRLLPTEYSSASEVHLMFDDGGRVDRFWFSLSFEPYPAARDTTLAFLNAKFGASRDETGTQVFEADTRIEVKEDTIGKAWEISVHPAVGSPTP